MPPDTTRASSSRNARKVVLSEEELTLRRARGEISCAECRRLKLKCDKRLPCSSCERRGCPNICPNGTLAAGQGSRFILSDTRDLHRKITEMSQRIRQLEDALAVFQASISSERHPLLSEELTAIKFWPEVRPEREENSTTRFGPVGSLDAFGTLSVGEQGEAKYFGRSAGGEALLLVGADMEGAPPRRDDSASTQDELSRILGKLPQDFLGNASDEILELVWNELPPQARAWSLCETYFEHASWFFNCVTRDEIVNEMIAPVYKMVKDRTRPDFNPRDMSSVGPHTIAVLYFTFAVGALMDLTLPAYNSEAERYFRLGRAAFSLRSVVDSPVVETVQAIALMSAYHGLDGQRYTMDSSWSLCAFATKLAQSLGLHRDCARWGLDAKTVERRRTVFWAIFTGDVMLSIMLGRPLSTPLSHIDCEFPTDHAQTVNENGEPEPSYSAWRYKVVKELMAPICERMLAAEPPSYEIALELDAKVRATPVPVSFKLFLGPEDEDRPSMIVQAYLLSQYRMNAMLVIHRSFFAQALLDHPLNPFRSPYAPSYLAAYRCASVVIKSSIHFFDRCPNLIVRFASFWSHAFSATLIMGFVVTRTPASNIAATAFVEFNAGIELFQKAAIDNYRARRALLVLRKLKVRADRVYSRSGPRDRPHDMDQDSNADVDRGPDELAVFGGKTSALPTKSLSTAWSNTYSRSQSTTPSSRIDAAFSPASDGSGVLPSPPGLAQPSLASQVPPLQWSDLAFPSESQAQEGLQVPSPGAFMAASQAGLFSAPSNVSSPQQQMSQDYYYGTTVAPAPADLSYMGLVPEGSGVDSQWMSLLRESGLLEPGYDGMRYDMQTG
ncbi:hypothetical protein GLOTRDRAFT_139640 [Gloeophyllum trabeum ATCC 11539]|uniref:Zn(2)-C6 fungal-type domain-containing protein n=1 Tax=Gloeophyllum trabeum (strain ATCC 11539 / FP-39264 / Madison 617) TaxID=670483 RepID=S7Q2W1_GLOTA|nr:uncharacterized protein GLOTRDRAFT_139640 [Gloeophyllum trabeum ATCC 11539]EPQ54336.1 hypothetical protein GLOTRDRAFT_139640 [Gloeophyllum trabeum ATCC 11539]